MAIREREQREITVQCDGNIFHNAHIVNIATAAL